MKLKTLAAALALMATGSAAFATTTAIFPTGPDDSIHIGASFKSQSAATTDLYTFSITAPAIFNGSLTSTALGKLDYDFTSIVLDGPGAYDFVFAHTGPDNMEKVEIGDTLLKTGSYTLRVLGKVDGTSGGSWGGDVNLVAVPVPEPETYALLAGGLGALGFLARRRRAD
jgi:hypothetical protein